MKPETIEQLRKISTPRQFHNEDYICHEGQPGNEMYIILKGSIGVFVTSVIGTLTHVTTIGVGDFFGEMAIFDNLPRSASCIALEDTLTVAINKDNLSEFLASCPEIAGQMLEKMSGRIRKLDAELYQNNRFVKNRHVPKFEIPYQHHEGKKMRPPYQDEELLTHYKQACPICGKAVSVTEVKRNRLEERSFDVDCQMTYMKCNPLWFEVIACENCYYTNHYLRFFGINNFEFELVKQVVEKEHKPIVESRIAKRNVYDVLVMRYLQAIHINEYINAGGDALIGGLWRNLYWLAKEAGEVEFALLCARKTIEKYRKALDENQFYDEASKTTTAMTLTAFMVNCKEGKECLKYADIAAKSPDARIRNNATRIKARLEKGEDFE